nr:hypothetical protein [Tanacetum cinerariifolium]
VSASRTSITDADAIERIQAACSSKEEIQKILNEVKRLMKVKQISKHNSLIKKSPSVSTSRTSIIDADVVERIQAACSSKEEIQKILNEVRRSPAPNGDLVILDEDDAVDGDLVYAVEVCDILGKLASAE